jgi:hypothetical protein
MVKCGKCKAPEFDCALSSAPPSHGFLLVALMHNYLALSPCQSQCSLDPANLAWIIPWSLVGFPQSFQGSWPIPSMNQRHLGFAFAAYLGRVEMQGSMRYACV